MGGRIYDVSQDNTRGSVTQVVGDICKLEFSLRNRFKKWLRDDGDGKSAGTGQLIFRPMDLVTVWLQRLPGNPIQQFTGYLDSVPYYQGYPGDAPFTATCTLKKLAYTWFDPGLQFFQTWLIQNGWVYDPTTGQAINPTLNFQTAAANNGISGTNLNDGGFGQLLRGFMTDVANWSPSDVLVSDLPPQLPKAAASLYKTLANQSEQSLQDLAEFFKGTMGVNVPNGSASITSQSLDVLGAIQNSANAFNIPAVVLAYAGYALTQFNVDYDTPAGPNWGYGIYALRPNNNSLTTTPPGLVPAPTEPLEPTTPLLVIGARKYTVNDLLDVSTASDALCQLLNANIGSWVAGARKGDAEAIQTWLGQALGRNLPQIDPTAAIKAANQFINASVVDQVSVGGLPVVDPTSISWTSTTLLNLLTDSEKQIVRNHYSTKSPWLAALVWRLKYFDSDLRVAWAPIVGSKLGEHDIFINGPTGSLQRAFNSIQNDTTIDRIEITYTGITPWTGTQGTATNQGHISTLGPDLPAGMIITQNVAPSNPVSTPLSPSNSSDATAPAGVVPWEDLATFAATSSFAANFAFPSDIIESRLLTGQKALMNDMSCLDAMKQLAAASMRTFRSLPDGRFLAFYPDYFGAYRDPYWSVDNIELINFGIVLNDEQLATHVYVVGDTVDFNNQVDLIEQLGTTGVATITQANMLHSFIEPWDPSQPQGELVGQLASAYDFLQHYGARPYKEDQPIIRSSTFEFLFAWQRFMQKWSQQFATTVEMTFQPEIFAGGIVAFPEHGVQMFVESVTHSWDYAGGFSTSAVMTAPSIPKASRKKNADRLPGFALAGVPVGIGAA